MRAFSNPKIELDRVSEPSGPALVSVRNVSVTYGSGQKAVRAIDDLSFDVTSGEFLCLVGPSGCGKTTLLRVMSGLLAPTSGTITFEGSVVQGPPARLALVFQEYTRSLYPWLTVEKNIGLPLSAKGVRRAEWRRRAGEALERVGLGDIGGMYPWQLSGGMQQRVAIARALAYGPDVLVMDEPFASVDAQARSDLEDLLLAVQKESDLTVVFVTHDIDESIYVGDRVIVLTDKPTRIKKVLSIDLARPRDQIATRSEDAFLDARAEVVRLIKGERGSRSGPSLDGGGEARPESAPHDD